MKDWADIREGFFSQGKSIKLLARETGLSRNTIRAAIRSESPPSYARPSRPSLFDAFEPAVRVLLAQTPDMPASVLAERVGWTRSESVFRAKVSALRGEFMPTDPASRTTYQPGELAQCDLWFPAVDIPLGMGQVGRPPVLVMASAYSRMITAVMLPSRQAPDLISGHWLLLQRWGSVPRALVWDNEAAVGSWRGGRPKLTDDFEAFRGLLGVKVIQCRPRDPEAKGIVERANQYLETSFLPGRTFTSPTDFNQQLTDWLQGKAAFRRSRVLGCRPIDRWDADRGLMLPLPPIVAAAGWRESKRLPRDHYVRLDANDYSVDPIAIGRMVQVHADTTTVTVRWGSRVVAEHARHWGKHQTVIDPAHHAAADRMRSKAGNHRQPVQADDVEQRSLSVYDQLLEAV